MKRDLIVFGEDWGGHPSSTQHLVKHLAKDRKVIWINSIGLRRPKLKLRDAKRAWNKLFASPGQPSIATPTPFPVVQPRTLPAPSSRIERQIAQHLLQSQLAPILQRADLHKPIFWTSLPTAVDMIGRLGDTPVVYYCGDDFGNLAGVDHGTVTKRENELVEHSQLIIAASHTLAKRFPSTITRCLPHGVDLELFSTPTPVANDLPKDGQRIAGFYGSLAEWLDQSLLQQVITQLPHWHFVFIGQATVPLTKLESLPNVTLLGSRPHHKLPGYSQHWDVSLLPFIHNQQIEACNPLKLLEYLATGRPVISTRFPAAEQFNTHIQIVDSATQMAVAIDQTPRSSSLPAPSYRLQQHTWQARAEQVSQWLDQL